MQLTTTQIAQALDVTQRAVQIRAAKESWSFVTENSRDRRYPLDSLPRDVQAAVIRAQAADVNLPSPIKEMPALNLSPRDLQNDKLMRRLKAAQYISTLPPYSGRREEEVQALADLYGVHRSTVWRWVQWAYNQGSRIAAEKAPELLLPKSSSFARQALAFGLAVYARNIQCGRKSAFQVLREKAGRAGWEVGDYSSFTRLVKQVPEDIWAMIEKGELGFELHYVPKIIRDWSAVPVQSIICGDQKIFDYEVYDPATGTIIIPNAYLWMDCSSRFINGVWIELGHYNSFTVGHSLREALRYGVPDEIFTDWGKPEGSDHIVHIRETAGRIAYTGDYNAFSDKYYLSHKKAQAEKPWQKPIENIMNQVDIILKGHFPPGYRKRQADAWENKVMQRRLKGEERADGLMTVDEFIDLIFKVIEEHNRKSKKLAEGGTVVPAEAFEKGIGGQTRIRLSDTTLDYLCLPTYERVPRQGKVGVQVRKGDFREFFSFKLRGLERVSVSIDPYDRKAPAVLTDPDGNFLDLAEPIPHSVPGESTPETERFFEVRSEYMKEIRAKARALKDGLGLVERGEIIAIGKAAHTASEIAHASREREQAHIHEARQAKLYKIEAARGRKELAAEMEEERELMVAGGNGSQFTVHGSQLTGNREPSTGNRQPAIGFSLPSDSKERYRLWKDLDARKTRSDDSLTLPESNFYDHFQKTSDFSAYRMLEEDFGEAFIK